MATACTFESCGSIVATGGEILFRGKSPGSMADILDAACADHASALNTAINLGHYGDGPFALVVIRPRKFAGKDVV